MPSFADSIFLFVLALLLFGPKKLPVLARELGKWMGEFRRASNEFKSQMEDELRASEQAERQKQIVAMEAAAPIPPALNDPPEPEHPHLRHSLIDPSPDTSAPSLLQPDQVSDVLAPASAAGAPPSPTASSPAQPGSQDTTPVTVDSTRPIPIATSGSLNMMPPATGLPTPRSSSPTRPNGNALTGLIDSIPETPATPANTPETESLAHGD